MLLAIRVAQIAVGIDAITHAPLELGGIGKAAVTLTLPDKLAVAFYRENAACSGPEAYFFQFLGKGRE